MGGISGSAQNADIGIPNQGRNEEQSKPTLVSPQPHYVGPFSFELVERLNSNRRLEKGLVFPPNTDRFVALEPGVIKQLSSDDQKIMIVLDSDDFSYIKLPAVHPAEQSNLIPLDSSEEARQAVRTWKKNFVSISSLDQTGLGQKNPTCTGTNNSALAFEEWDHAKFEHAAVNQEWCKDLNADQINALVHFMNVVQVRNLAEVDAALSPAMFTGQRPAFEAACAVYESGLGRINGTGLNKKTCLQEMAMAQAVIPHKALGGSHSSAGEAPLPVELEERFERAIKLGADPFITDKDGKSALGLAAENGCLEQLVQAMGNVLPLDDIDLVLHWRNDKERNILSLAVASGEEAITAVRKLVARKVCGNFVPQYSFSTEGTSLREKVKADWNGTLSDRQVAALARFMEVAQLTQAHPQDVIDALHPALATGYRRAFEAARAVYASGVGDINERNANSQICLHELPDPQIPDHEWTDNETGKVEFEERLAVMLELGADPFSTGSDGKLESALQFAESRLYEEMLTPLSAIKETLFKMADKSDSALKRAIHHASSAEAMNFLCDLGVKLYDEARMMTVPAALAAYLKRDPSALDATNLTPKCILHRFQRASAGIIATYLDAIRARKLPEGNSPENVAKAIRNTLDWSLDIRGDGNKTSTLFNCACSTESAELLLKTRLDARLGEQDFEWKNWCDREWDYLEKNQDIVYLEYQLPVMELVDILLRYHAYPSTTITSRPGWGQLQAKVTAYREASELWKQIQRGERDFKSLKKQEWEQVATHAYRVVSLLSPERCKEYCRELGDYLLSASRCSRETRIVFLKTAYAGKMSLGESNEFEQQRNTWDALVGVIAYTFRRHDKGSLKKNVGLNLQSYNYVGIMSEEMAKRLGSGEINSLHDALT